MKLLGYADGDRTPAILRVDQLRCFRKRDAEPPAAFEGLLAE